MCPVPHDCVYVHVCTCMCPVPHYCVYVHVCTCMCPVPHDCVCVYMCPVPHDCVYVHVSSATQLYVRSMYVVCTCPVFAVLTFVGSLWKSLSWKWTRSCSSCVQTTSISLSNTWLQYLPNTTFNSSLKGMYNKSFMS